MGRKRFFGSLARRGGKDDTAVRQDFRHPVPSLHAGSSRRRLTDREEFEDPLMILGVDREMVRATQVLADQEALQSGHRDRAELRP
jgi:hypothetical protein